MMPAILILRPDDFHFLVERWKTGELSFFELEAEVERARRNVEQHLHTSQIDCVTGKLAGERKGCRFYSEGGIIYDADWNAAINIAKRYKSKHPLSPKLPLDGTLAFGAGFCQQANRGDLSSQAARSLASRRLTRVFSTPAKPRRMNYREAKDLTSFSRHSL